MGKGKDQLTETQIKNQLAAKWPDISKSEVKDILVHHDHLRKSLRNHYNMSEVRAKDEEVQFFKGFEAKPKQQSNLSGIYG